MLEGYTREQVLMIDSVVLSIGFQPEDGLYKQLRDKFTPIFTLGDCHKAGNIMEAIWNAYDVAREI